jgi:hypothetical protein
MSVEEGRRIIVVLSPGRSGTSLLMNILSALGMSVSENMISGSVGNPEGFFEDREIVEIHKNLLEELHTNAVLPLPDGWVEFGVTRVARRKLRDILEMRLEKSNTIWGFKDPRTGNFLPLWNRMLNEPGIVPCFLLAVRHPASVAASLNRQIGRKVAITELQWLQRTTDALHHTGADCYIVQYEDWFTRPNELAQGLCRYTGLDNYFNGNVDDALRDVIKPNLNRAVYEDYCVENEYVLKLYDILKDCRGDDFDRAKLMAVVKECRKAMNGFKGWYMEAQKYLGREKELRKKVKEKSELQANLEAAKAKAKELRAKTAGNGSRSGKNGSGEQ